MEERALKLEEEIKQLKKLIMDYKKIAEELWDLLDHIDTASDMFKPSETNGLKSFDNFYKYAMKKSEERHKLMKSDGYNLYSNEEFEKLPKDDKGRIKPPEFDGERPLMKRNC